MAFTFNRVEFVNLREYDEVLHALSLSAGIPNYVVDGLEIDLVNNNLTNGRGINLGCIFTLGKFGETQDFTPIVNNYYIIIKTTLNGSSSSSEIQISSTFKDINNSSANIKYFTLYEIDGTSIVQDFRHINYVKDLYFKDLGDDEFSLVLNGFESQPFNTSVIQNTYSKSEANARFGNKSFKIIQDFAPGDKLDLSQMGLVTGKGLYEQGFSRVILANTDVTDQPDLILHISDDNDDKLEGYTLRKVPNMLQVKLNTFAFTYNPALLTFTFNGDYGMLLSVPDSVQNSAEPRYFTEILFDNSKGLDILP